MVNTPKKLPNKLHLSIKIMSTYACVFISNQTWQKRPKNLGYFKWQSSALAVWSRSYFENWELADWCWLNQQQQGWSLSRILTQLFLLFSATLVVVQDSSNFCKRSDWLLGWNKKTKIYSCKRSKWKIHRIRLNIY